MLLLLILADDFTGALDTGVQFAACGIPTRVVVGEQVDFAANDAAVLVVDTETRHLPAAEAYAVIAKLTREAMSAGVFSIYKKTDSALRGNIGAELSALLKTSGERQLSFLPAAEICCASSPFCRRFCAAARRLLRAASRPCARVRA